MRDAITASKLPVRGTFFESPRWHDGHWWVSDMFADRILQLAPDGAVRQCITVPDHPSGLGWLPDGRMLVALMESRCLIEVTVDGTQREYAALSSWVGGPANDMLVDAQGRAWVGNI